MRDRRFAAKHGLKVIVGLSAEQSAGYLIDTEKAPDIGAEIRAKVRNVAGHEALLCYALGNEIPAQLARWIGPVEIEHYLHRLYRAVKAEDPEGLVTYVNYPTTEYLPLPFYLLYVRSQNPNIILEPNQPQRLDLTAIRSASSTDVFMVKLAYWIG